MGRTKALRSARNTKYLGRHIHVDIKSAHTYCNDYNRYGGRIRAIALKSNYANRSRNPDSEPFSGHPEAAIQFQHNHD